MKSLAHFRFQAYHGLAILPDGKLISRSCWFYRLPHGRKAKRCKRGRAKAQHNMCLPSGDTWVYISKVKYQVVLDK